jgi:acyl-coenzyme A thioesterase PaaI-like protein
MSSHRPSRRWSPRQLRWLLSAYPPLFFQRVRVLEIDPGYRRALVRVRRSILSRNLQGSTFGGTIYSAVDPFHALLLWQICAQEGMRVQAWMKQAVVDFIRPAESHLTIEFVLDDSTVERALQAVREIGRFAHVFQVEAKDEQGAVCAVVKTDIRIIYGDTERPAAS